VAWNALNVTVTLKLIRRKEDIKEELKLLNEYKCYLILLWWQVH